MLKDLVAIVDNGEAAKGFVDSAVAFAKAHDAHLALTLLTDIFFDPALMSPVDQGVLATYQAYGGVMEEIEAMQKRRIATVSALVENADIPVEVRAVTEAPGYLSGAARIEGRYSDMILAGLPSAYDNDRQRRRVIEAALMGSAGPVLLLPDDARLGRIGHVVLGWDASGEARRAARDVLQVASPGARIDVVAVDAEASDSGHGPSPGADIARHLARHGFDVAVHRESSTSRSVSTVLETFAIDHGADLLAVGAFAHSRIRDILLGGVTRELLHETRVPVMLSR